MPDVLAYTHNKSSESISRKTVHKVPEMGNLAIGKNNTEEDLYNILTKLYYSRKILLMINVFI